MKEKKQRETLLLLLFYSHQDNIKSAASLAAAFISGINQVYDHQEHQINKIK